MKKILCLFVFLFSLFMLNNRINAYTEYNEINYRVIRDNSDRYI